jgi:RNA polymerase sigma-70 factor (ECF subfamily)
MVSQIEAWEPEADVPGGFADESALVAGLRARDPQAFAAFHTAYAASIYNVALRVVEDAHEAQDVAQEVLIKVLQGLPREDEGLSLPAWLYRVTVNAAFDHLRARRRRPVVLQDDLAPESVATVDEYERAELAQRVETTLKQLPKRQQLALVLRDVHGLSVGETASALGVTKGSVEVLLSRARAGFRSLYLAGALTVGRCAVADGILAGGVGGGMSAADRALLEAHVRSCPDCRRTAELWGAAPAGLGLLLPQAALPAKLSLAATMAAAQAAGIVAPVGLGAAGASGAAGAGGGSAAVSAASAASAAGTAAVAAPAAGGATGGVLAAVGSAAGIKFATLAAVTLAAVGVAGAAARHQASPRPAASSPVVVAHGSHAGADGGLSAGERPRAGGAAQAHRGEPRSVRGGAGAHPGGAGRSDRAASRFAAPAGSADGHGDRSSGRIGAGGTGRGGTFGAAASSGRSSGGARGDPSRASSAVTGDSAAAAHARGNTSGAAASSGWRAGASPGDSRPAGGHATVD